MVSLAQTTTEPLVSHRTAPAAKAVPWAALVAAALVSVIVGLGLLESLGIEHSAPLPARHRLAARAGLASLPAAAQGAVSAALGADSPAYRVRPSGGEFQAQSTPQRLHIRFGSSGVSLSSGATHVGLSLRAFGYGSSLPALGAVTPRVHGNRVTYARPGVSEWYVNGPLGLEQGFTIPAPSRHQAGALGLELALSGNARAALGWGGQSISLTSAAGPPLRYSGVRASDARGRPLHSWLQLTAGRLELRVDTRGARYPVRVDPFVQQGAKLTGGGESGKGWFGFSVALSPDGNTALIGGPFDNSEVGAAWVFTRSGSVWTEQAKLTGGSEIGKATFGWSVALATTKGDTAIIGGPNDNTEVGAAWVFTRSGSTWTQQAKLTGSGETGAGHFGSSVALASTKGETALIGGERDNTLVGAAWVFTGSGSTWTQQAKLTGGGESGGGEFGSSVALSAEGTTALIGGRRDKSEVGAAWVFTGSGSTWTQQAELTGGGGVGATRFGNAVALSSEGNTALIGGPGDHALVGTAWVFTLSGSWTQQAKLTGSGESGKAEFGSAVALSAAGNTAMIGGPEDNTRVGAAWFFVRPGTTWIQQGSKRTGTGETGTGEFANSVALSSDGNTALSGASGDNSEAGAAWVFVFQTPSPPAVVTEPATSVNQTRATLNGTVNPNGGEVTKCEFEYGETTFGKTAPCTPSASSLGQGESPVAVSAAIRGLNPNTTYKFRITATNAGGTNTGAEATFKTLAPIGTPPTVENKPASGVVAHTATLNATVNPNGGEVYECFFEYGETTLTKTEKCSALPGSGTMPVAVSATVSGLAANTTYKFRAVALNPGGTGTGAPEETFKTTLVNPPTVITAAASSITQTSATLNATVNPNEGEVNDCKFEWGETTTYTKTEKCLSLPGSGTSPVAVSAAIAGLTNKTTYHFRISATNVGGGTSKGADQTFNAASTHVYKNGIVAAQKVKARTIGWGTLKITTASFVVECHTITGGYMENPTGGGSAIGKVQAFAPYECVSASCKEAGGTAIELTSENLPWSTEATEIEGGAFRMRTGNRIKAAEAVFLGVNCVGVKNTQFSAEDAPKVLNNGISIGVAPDEEEFDQPGSGELESEAGGLKFAGKVKYQGYGSQELIEVKNP